MKTVIKTNKDADFYQLIGPYLAKRKIEREIGYKIYDDDNKSWVFAIKENILIGFCYYQKASAGKYHIGSCYVVEQYRSNGVFKKLLHEALKQITGTVCIRTKNNIMKSLLKKEGFLEGDKIGSYTEFKKEVKL